MPSALAITRSSGVVMKPRTRSALAPTYAVVTRTTAMSLRGYWRTLSARMDCSPAMRMTRLTTMARTGRLTKMSVSFMTASVVLRLRRRVVGGLDGVVHVHGRAVPELEDARGHDLLARLHTGGHRHLVATAARQLDELLAHALVLLAL